ncbi:hypothetical protein BDZ91DRAFT_347101 [Kalaharituber pfeilii]|nr:hypothetical protein BDZ91DRAFT_347101 [Kalaharituber pfeilii]
MFPFLDGDPSSLTIPPLPFFFLGVSMTLRAVTPVLRFFTVIVPLHSSPFSSHICIISTSLSLSSLSNSSSSCSFPNKHSVNRCLMNLLFSGSLKSWLPKWTRASATTSTTSLICPLPLPIRHLLPQARCLSAPPTVTSESLGVHHPRGPATPLSSGRSSPPADTICSAILLWLSSGHHIWNERYSNEKRLK